MTDEEKNLMYQLWNENLRIKTDNWKRSLALWMFKDVNMFSARYYCSNCGHITDVWGKELPLKCGICNSPMIDYEFYKRLHKVNDYINLSRVMNNSKIPECQLK